MRGAWAPIRAPPVPEIMILLRAPPGAVARAFLEAEEMHAADGPACTKEQAHRHFTRPP